MENEKFLINLQKELKKVAPSQTETVNKMLTVLESKERLFESPEYYCKLVKKNDEVTGKQYETFVVGLKVSFTKFLELVLNLDTNEVTMTVSKPHTKVRKEETLIDPLGNKVIFKEQRFLSTNQTTENIKF